MQHIQHTDTRLNEGRCVTIALRRRCTTVARQRQLRMATFDDGTRSYTNEGAAAQHTESDSTRQCV